MINNFKKITIRNNIKINKSKDLFEILKCVNIYKHKFKLGNEIIESEINFKNKNFKYFDNLIFEKNYENKDFIVNDYFINGIQLKIREIFGKENYKISFYEINLVFSTIYYFNNINKKINNNMINKIQNYLEIFLTEKNEVTTNFKYELILNFLEKIKIVNLINYEFFESMLYFLYYNFEFLENYDKFRFINICFKFNFIILELDLKISNLNINQLNNNNLINLLNIINYINLNKIKEFNESEIVYNDLNTITKKILIKLNNHNFSNSELYKMLMIKESIKNEFSEILNLEINAKKLNIKLIENFNYFEFDIKKHLDYCEMNYEYQVLINDFISVDYLINFPNKKVILEINGPIHYYKNSELMTNKTVYKTLLLKKLGYIIINIKYDE